jgi:hypothetical protein
MTGRRLPALDATLLALGGLLLFIEIGLATDGNWPKMLRVGVAVAGYVTMLLVTGARRQPFSPWRYVASALVGGALSGIVRPEIRPAFAVAQAVLAALLLGPAHWLLVRRLSLASAA